MAGSMKWFKYTADDDTVFAIYLDESNTEALNGTGSDYADTDTNIYAVPRNVKPRYISYSNSARTRTIRAVALTPTIYNGVVPTDTIPDAIAGTGNLTVRSKTPEKIRLPYAADTGLNDGDAT